LPSLALRSHALQCAAVAVTVFVFSVGSYSAVCGVPRNMPREPPGGSAATAGRRASSSASAARVTSPRRSRGSKRSARMCTAHTRRAGCCSHRRRRRCAQRRWLEAVEIPHPSTHASVQHVPRQRRDLIWIGIDVSSVPVQDAFRYLTIHATLMPSRRLHSICRRSPAVGCAVTRTCVASHLHSPARCSRVHLA
jgi:hypothetical protein